MKLTLVTLLTCFGLTIPGIKSFCPTCTNVESHSVQSSCTRCRQPSQHISIPTRPQSNDYGFSEPIISQATPTINIKDKLSNNQSPCQCSKNSTIEKRVENIKPPCRKVSLASDSRLPNTCGCRCKHSSDSIHCPHSGIIGIENHQRPNGHCCKSSCGYKIFTNKALEKPNPDIQSSPKPRNFEEISPWRQKANSGQGNITQMTRKSRIIADIMGSQDRFTPGFDRRPQVLPNEMPSPSVKGQADNSKSRRPESRPYVMLG